MGFETNNTKMLWIIKDIKILHLVLDDENFILDCLSSDHSVELIIVIDKTFSKL